MDIKLCLIHNNSASIYRNNYIIVDDSDLSEIFNSDNISKTRPRHILLFNKNTGKRILIDFHSVPHKLVTTNIVTLENVVRFYHGWDNEYETYNKTYNINKTIFLGEYHASI